MKYLCFLSLLFFLSCYTAPTDKIHIELKNGLDETIKIYAVAGRHTRPPIILPPGSRWIGWVVRGDVDRIEVRISR